MRNKLTKTLPLGILAIFLVLPIFLPTIAQRDNREDYPLENLSGEKVQLSKLGEKPKWLLVYVQQDSAFSLKLLEVFKKDFLTSTLDDKLVVIVGGANRKQTEDLARRIYWIPAASWYFDDSRKTLKNFEIKTIPLTLGMYGSQEKWRFAGIAELNSPPENSLVSWLTNDDDVRQMEIEKENNRQK